MNKNLNNQEFIDGAKKINNIRFIASNPNGFGPENSEKIEILCEKVIEMKIDIKILSTPNR